MDIRRRGLSVEGNNVLEYEQQYFTIHALENGLTAKLNNNASHYRIDDGEWVSLTKNTTTPSINKGQKISFKITNPTISSSYGISTLIVNKKAFNVEGNIMSLLYGDDFQGQTGLSGKKYAFYKLFNNCTTLKNAENLILPATTLADRCYQYMFSKCTSLTTAPELPATTLAWRCYEYMFQGCTSLETAPELPATTLAVECYQNMFNNCTSLTEAPELLAETLASYCYSAMFRDCTSLTTVPEALPATTLANYCYSSMFDGCTSLTTAPQLPATTLTDHCYSTMFSGCTSLIESPQLPATTLANYCYNGMFRDCTSLKTSPQLPATTLADCCYQYMFYGTNVLPDCSNIDFTDKTIVKGKLIGLFAGTKVTDADLERLLPKNNEGKYCLPVTTLAERCYYHMFDNCTSLTTAPELPATTLARDCYNYMFYGCSKLNYIKMLATNISATDCLYNWVGGVALSGTFVKHPDMTTLPTGTSGIPTGWTVVNDGEESGSDTSKNLITFTIDGTEYQAEEGMTWEEWCNSEYNTDEYYVMFTTVFDSNGTFVYDTEGNTCYSNEMILANKNYILGY